LKDKVTVLDLTHFVNCSFFLSVPLPCLARSILIALIAAVYLDTLQEVWGRMSDDEY